MSSLISSEVLAKCTLSSPVPWAIMQLGSKLPGLVHGRRIHVAFGIILRAAHVALGVDRVVEPPVGDGRDGHARLENVRGVEERIRGSSCRRSSSPRCRCASRRRRAAISDIARRSAGLRVRPFRGDGRWALRNHGRGGRSRDYPARRRCKPFSAIISSHRKSVSPQSSSHVLNLRAAIHVDRGRDIFARDRNRAA